ncbi:D-aminoacyl-tRNA deacylase [Dethiosulfovibrio salsuginis]|uniref:D-aminoacyl-tRNA deacylase n=1 Tax=Dethiosulfovibrio salsuginis TaxID=561720 RepID=A0A1X7J9I1_9BACT|nr:D-aminoacyl-tRNA deacylase [Dethiosulfovibrio salsuginis]SMG24463.1 D-tyrosyl-tRNA(Tyr) deacylase [Dethiosulfovibrio salsuginis]
MKAVVQRVLSSAVVVDGEEVGRIGNGLCVLLGVTHGDGPDQARWLSDKIASLRVFEDQNGKLNLSLKEVDGQVLVVSQFTLYADCRKGRRPSFVEAAEPVEAKKLYELFVDELKAKGLSVATGVFQAHMDLEIHNDGPVTLIIETPEV